jgi:hypothetical protein
MEEALAAAASRLLAMGPCSFRSRMDNDDVFRSVVTGIANHACIVNPINGEQMPPCGVFAEIWAREWRRGPNGAQFWDNLDGWLYNLANLRWQGAAFERSAAEERGREAEAARKAGKPDENGKPLIDDPPPCPTIVDQESPDPTPSSASSEEGPREE